MRDIFVISAGLTVLLLTGCGGSDNAPTPQPVAAKTAEAKTSQAIPQDVRKLVVAIIPDPPTADGCIKALVSGSHQASYRWEVNGQEVAGQSANVLCEGFRRGDDVKVIVSAGKAGGSGSVKIANAPPRITEVAVNSDGIARHAALEIRPTVIDVDGDPIELRYQWYVNNEADSFLSGTTLPADRYERGDAVRFTIVASDGTTDSKLYQSETLAVANAPPRIESTPPQKFEALEYSYQVKASDPDGDSLSWRLDKAPQGMTINPASGLINWPLTGVKAGVYPMKIVVSDPAGAEAFQEFDLTLGAPK